MWVHRKFLFSICLLKNVSKAYRSVSIETKWTYLIYQLYCTNCTTCNYVKTLKPKKEKLDFTIPHNPSRLSSTFDIKLCINNLKC